MKYKVKYTKTFTTCIEVPEGATRDDVKRKFHIKHPKGKITSIVAYSVRESLKPQVISLHLGMHGDSLTNREIANKLECSESLVSQYINDWYAENNIQRQTKDILGRDPGHDARTPQH